MKKNLFFFIFIFLFVFLPCFSGQRENALKFYQLSKSFLKKGKKEQAVIFYYKAKSLDSTALKNDKSFKDYSRKIEPITESYISNAIFKARVLYNDEKYDLAISILQQIKLIKKDDFEINELYKTAMTAKKQLRLISEQEKFKNRIKIVTKNSGSTSHFSSSPTKKTPKYLLISKILDQIDEALSHQKFDKAISLINTALKIDSRNIALKQKIKDLKYSQNTILPYRNGGRLFKQKQYNVALSNFLKVYKIDRNFLDVSKYIAICYLKQNDIKSAKKYIEEYLNWYSDDIELLGEVFNYFYNKENYHTSQAILNRIHSENPSKWSEWESYLEVIYWKMNYKSLILLCVEILLFLYLLFTIYSVVELSAVRKRLNFKIIDKLIQSFNYPKAISILQDYLAVFSDDLNSRIVLAYLYDLEHDELNSKTQIQFILHKHPDNLLAKINLSSLNFKMGNLKSALGDIISAFGDKDYKEVLPDEYRKLSFSEILENYKTTEVVFYLLFNNIKKSLPDHRYLIK